MLSKVSFLFVVLFVVLFSCNFESKNGYISSFDSFVTKTSENYKNYDDKAWAKADTAFSHFSDRDYNKWESKLTPEESAHVNELIGKYQALKVKAGIKDLKDGVNNLMKQAGSFIKELTSDSTLSK